MENLLTLALSYIWTVAYYYYLVMVPVALYRWGTTGRGGNRQQALREKTLMIVFGSGGHTTEMLLMLVSKEKNEFEFKKYNQVHFVIGHSDTWSMTKIKDFFSAKNPGFDVFRDIPNLRVDRVYRSREVKQSYFTSIFTTLIALAHSVYLVASIRPDIVSTHLSTNSRRSSPTARAQQSPFAMLTSCLARCSCGMFEGSCSS